MEKRFYWIYITVFINVIASGMIFPILPLFATSFNASSFQVGLLTAVFALTQFLAAPIIGQMSDRYGRKPIFIFSIFTTASALFLIGISQNLGMIFFGMAIQGLGSAGVLPSALAYVADVAKGDNRTKYISRVTGMFAFGFMIGPSVGGFLGSQSLSLPFYIATIIGVINLVIITLFLKETHHNRAKSLAVRQGLISPRILARALKGKFGLLFFLLFAWAFYISNYSLTIPFFTVEKFSFDTIQNGIFFSIVGFTAALTQWFVLPNIEKKIGDVKTIFLGLLMIFVGQSLAPFSFNPILFYVIFIISVIGSSLMRPSTNALLSKRTTEGQGATMGLAFSFESSGRIVGPLILGFIMASWNVTIPFYITALVVLIATVLFYKLEVQKN